MENIETLLAAVAAQTQGFGDDDDSSVSTSPALGFDNSVSSGVNRGEFGRSELTGAQPEVYGEARPSSAANPSPAVGELIGAGDKRKRGRPPRGFFAPKPQPPKRKKQEDDDDEEDVCFICFDGGSLVLCDKKGCPKAYHPACIKRDEAFFKSKAKWNCGWHICSVCRKSSHYLCYTCTYSLCKGCTKDTDYLCVRGNRGFCSTCMKTIMLIENKDQANSESIQVDFDDITSWEYLFKVYWVILKEKLSLTLTELTQARRPWKGVPAVAHKPQLSSVHSTAVNGAVAISVKSTECLELNKPHVDICLPQNDGLRTETPSIYHAVEKLCRGKGEDGKSHNNDMEKASFDKVKDEATFDKAPDEPSEKDGDNPSAVEDAGKPCICKHIYDKEPEKPSIDINAEWASKDLLEFVAHMKNGDTSALSQFDVQTLMLDYIKRNNLRDPHQKSQIICDLRLKNLFGKARVGHIEMLKLLEFHFLIKDECEKSSFIPAGFVGSIASDMEVDENSHGLSTPINSRKRKTRKKNKERVPQNNLDEYAAIDVHNINLIYLRRNLMENLIDDQGTFNTKVVGSIVRIRISSNDQKQDVYRLVQVVGTTKVAEPYKIGDKTADVMLEVLNLDKKEVVSIDSISNQDFTEDECRRLRQSIRCGLVKQFTVGEVQKKAMSIQVVRVNAWLEAEILRLNHLRDRASEKGRKKELREYVNKLQLLKSPEERQRRISEVPEIHADPKMSPNYASEEDTRAGDNSKNDDYVRPSYSGFPRNGKKSISHNKKGKEGSVQAQDRITTKIDSTAERPRLEASMTTTPVGNSPNSNNIETEKLWHYRDPNGKIQGPFSMMQLRIWSTTGLFPTDMRIWTNHEQYDSVLLNDALNGLFHGPPDLSIKPSSRSEEEHVEATEETVGGSVGKNGNTGDTVSVLIGNNNGSVRADQSWPKCLDLLKDNNPSTDDVEPIPDRGQESDEIKHGSHIGDNNSSGLTQNQLNSKHELQNHSDDSVRGDPPSEENFRPLHIDLSSSFEPGPIFAALLKSPDSNKPDMDINLSNLPNPIPKAAENLQLVESSDVPMQNSGILELLSLSPRTNSENPETETKESGSRNFSGQNPGPSWNLQQIPEIGEEWCGYSPTPSSMKPPEITNESNPASNIVPDWLSIIGEPIEFDALGEESVSDLLAEVDAMESQGGLPSPTSAMKFARELMQDCKDDCFSSIEDFSSAPVRSDAFSSTGLPSQSSSVPFKPIDALDSFRKSGSLHSSGSSEGETNAPVSGEAGSSKFHPPAQSNTSQDIVDPGWGTVQGNINLVTVQGNVNLVLGGPGPGQGMANLGWGANPGSSWVNNPNISQSPINGSLPWDPQRKYPGERFTSPREWGGGYQGNGEPGFGRGRPPWGRQSYGGGGGGGGGGYLRGFQKGNRVCKFYGSGHCKKGAFCDYLHPNCN